MVKIILSFICLSIMLVGCRSNDKTELNSSPNQVPNVETTQTDTEGEALNQTEISVGDVIEVVTQEVLGTVIKIDYEIGKPSFYQVEVLKDQTVYELEVNAVNKEVLNRREEKQEELISLGEVKVSIGDAWSIALSQAGGGTLESIELDQRANLYEVNLVKDQQDYEIEISAMDGSVIKCERQNVD